MTALSEADGALIDHSKLREYKTDAAAERIDLKGLAVIDRAGLAVDRLAVDRGGRPILRDLSFHLEPGTAIAVTGSNGVGKSTLLRALVGLLPKAGGTVTLRLQGVPGLAELPEHTHYLGHGNGLKTALTASENVRFFADWGGGGKPDDALASVGLGHVGHLPVNILSAGQRRRVAIAGLLAARRPLWLLDEPATALDAASEGMLAGLLRAHLARSGMIVAAIHGPLGLPARALRLDAS